MIREIKVEDRGKPGEYSSRVYGFIDDTGVMHVTRVDTWIEPPKRPLSFATEKAIVDHIWLCCQHNFEQGVCTWCYTPSFRLLKVCGRA